MLELQSQAHREAGGVFNVDSPKQLQEILFGKLGIPVMRKTPTGQPSTAEDVLEELADTYPLPKLILGISRHRQAQIHLHGQSAATDQSVDRTHSHFLPSSRGGDRQAVLDGSESAKHSDPHAGGAAHPTGVRRAARPLAGRSGLFADRTANHGASFRRRDPCCRAFAEDRDVHQATAAEVFGVALGSCHRRSAPIGEGDQFRTHVRHVRVRPGAPARHCPRRCAEVHGSIFRTLPRREALHGRDAPSGARSRLRGNCVRPQAVSSRRFSRAMRPCANTPNAVRSMRPCRAPQPTSSNAP